MSQTLNQWLPLDEETVRDAVGTIRVSGLVAGGDSVRFTLGGIDMQSFDEDPLVVAAAFIRLGERIAAATVEHRGDETPPEAAPGLVTVDLICPGSLVRVLGEWCLVLAVEPDQLLLREWQTDRPSFTYDCSPGERFPIESPF